MALKRKYSICSLFVLFFGLISCSQDKEKEIVYQPSPLSGQNVGAVDSQGKMQWARDIKELDLGGELTIDFLKQQNFQANPITVRVQSWCRTDTAPGDLYNDLYFQNQFSIPVLNVLAPEALLSLSQQPLSCRMVLTLTDSISSQAIYPIDNIMIRNSLEFSNIENFAKNQTLLFYEQLKAEALPQGEQQQLLCEDFQKTTRFAESWEQLMNSSPLDMSRWTKATQLCRLLIKSNNLVLLSPQFRLVFQPQDLLIRPTLYNLPAPTLELNSRQIVTLRILNPNHFGVRLQIQRLQESRLVFVPVYSGMGAVGYTGQQREFPLTWSLQSTPYIQNATDQDWIIDLPSQQEIILDGFSHGKLFCDTELRARPHLISSIYQSFPYFVGVQYGLDLQTQISIHLADNEWLPVNLKQGDLSALNHDSRPYWDLFYEAARAAHGPFWQNPARTKDEFLQSIHKEVSYDRCAAM